MTMKLKRGSGRVRSCMFVCVLVVSGCTDTGFNGNGVDRRTFKANYLSARSALEGGDYSKAIDKYRELVGQSGPMTNRVRIEFAHSLLRANQFEAAANEAHIAAIEMTGLARASALSVQATAMHEMALERMAQGTYDRGVHDALVSAREIFDRIKDDLPQLDPKGGLQRRHTAALKAEAELKTTLGL